MIYAKSNPPESLKEHTERVMKNFDLLKNTYDKQIRNLLPEKYKETFWKALEIACYYHDFGKLSTPFQNKIIKAINPNQKRKTDDFRVNIPHNLLSPAFIDKSYIEKEGINEELYPIIIQAITFHHENKKILSKELKEEIKSAIDNDLSKNLDELNREMGTNINKLNKKFTIDIEKRIGMNDKNYLIYLLLKGLLHRIDHSASAHVDIEMDASENIEEKAQFFITEKLKSKSRELQTFASNNKNENLILIASTGMGKTEAALMWIGKEKGFIVLPLRVTLNKMFSRLTNEVEIKSTGLLHSTNLDYLLSEEINYEYSDSLRIVQQSRQFAMKLNLTTVDQIFTFPFKPLGYEKVLSTLLYSKVVLDEIQAYSPNIAAAILKGIEILYKNGGKFMIMTATLPQIYRDYLDQKGIKYEVKEFLMDEDPSGVKNRHFMIVKDDDISNDIDNIVEYGKDHKVLVIVNTIKKAIDIYKNIRDKTKNVNLLHSMFIQKDRLTKENQIYQSSESNASGIWVTTQIVEASLDIDFDALFTELSTLDSLFQRMGRCYRKREYQQNRPNVFVYSKASGIGTIYDKDIFNIGLDKIRGFNEIINERSKIDLVSSIYSFSSIQNTKYYEEFKKSLEILDHTSEYEMDSKTAQSILRDIKSVKIIPREIYDQNAELFKEYNKLTDREKRIREHDISSLSTDIPYYKIKRASLSDEIFRDFGIYILDCKYDQELGVQIEEELSNIIG
ncbi:MAG: CRISPR-associated helicase Cas3' [Thermoplasmata archaeon]